ncbi:MAG: hypothetical protein PVS3B3_03670 [Ktedonobacteraceae bacterium]
MNYSHTILFAEDISEDDEIDALFNQLQQIAPPPMLVEDILTSIAQLGMFIPPRPTQKLWEDMGLVLYSGDLEPS